MRRVLLLLLLAAPVLAQAPAVPQPPVMLGGSVGIGAKVPFFNNGSVTMADADYTLQWPDFSASVIQVVGGQTAVHTLFAPAAHFGFEYTVQNFTSGGYSIVVKPEGNPGSAGVTIPNGQTMMVVFNGTDYVSPSAGGGVSNAGPLAQGTPVYGNGGAAVMGAATELAVDAFPGADVCAKAMAAQAALPAQGGTIRFSAQNYPACAASITINKPNITLQGAGGGNVLGGPTGWANGATVLNFAAGVSGIVSSGTQVGGHTYIVGLTLISASTAAGSDNGIYITQNGSPYLRHVRVKHFGGNGVWMGEQTDFWHLEDVEVDSVYGDGFEWANAGGSPTTCTDVHLGVGLELSSTNNHGWGFNVQCGLVNTFQSTHASGNTAGAWNVQSGYNYFIDAYVESGLGSSFIIGTQSGYNRISFNGFGQPQTITDSSVGSTNTIQLDTPSPEGTYTAVSGISLTGLPQNAAHPMYSWIVGLNAFGANDLLVRDRTNGVNIEAYVPATGFNFLRPVKLGTDNSVAGSLAIANGTVFAHTTITTQATANSAFALPANNGTSGYVLSTDGAGNTSWIAPPAVGPSGPSGVTNSAPANVIAKSDGTNLMASSLSDTGTQITTTTPLNAGSLSTGTSPPLGCSLVGCFALSESSTTGTPTTGVDYCRADSASHSMLCSFNGGAESVLATGAPSFSVVGAGTNTHPLIIGTGGSLTASGGTIAATSLSAASALPSGTTATTQTPGDSSTNVATTAFVNNALAGAGVGPTITSLIEYFCSGLATTGNIGNLAWSYSTVGSAPIVSGVTGAYPHRCILQFGTATAATQGQGGTLYLSPSGGTSASWGDFASNTNWSITNVFALPAPASSVFRTGLWGQSNILRPGGMGLLYDTDSPLSGAAISGITCTTTICTVTMTAAHNLVVPGQGFTIVGESCPTRNLNATYAFGSATGVASIPTTTTFTFRLAGAAETCTTQGTVSTAAQSDFGFAAILNGTTSYTVLDSGITADSNWHTFNMFSTVAGTIMFRIDNGTAVAISTTVPTINLFPMIIIGTDITAQKTVQLNYFSYLETGVAR